MDSFYMKVVIHNLKMFPISVVSLSHTSMFNIKYPMFMVHLCRILCLSLVQPLLPSKGNPNTDFVWLSFYELNKWPPWFHPNNIRCQVQLTKLIFIYIYSFPYYVILKFKYSCIFPSIFFLNTFNLYPSHWTKDQVLHQYKPNGLIIFLF
jgi:hypothetical protein